VTESQSGNALSRQFVGAAAALLPLLNDPGVTDILVNGPGVLFVERNGHLVPEISPFSDSRALHDFIERLLIPLGKRIDAAHPYLDGKLGTSGRFHVVLPPIAPGGPLISIRKNRAPALCPLSSFGDTAVMQGLVEDIRHGCNFLVAGGTGAGKTTLLARLLDQVDPGERVAIIEEVTEIQSLHPHQISLEARPPSPDGTGEVSLRELIRNALRMRPNRIVLGECRGAEAFELVQAMNTGHPGSLCTLHANSAMDALRRLEGLVIMGGNGLGVRTVRDWIASAIQRVVYVERQGDRRTVREVLQLQGIEGEVYRILPRYRAGRLEYQPGA
jgi:pilus assembly protein CpaF